MQKILAAVILPLVFGVHAETTSDDDPYIWLEDVLGEDSLAWVEEQNVVSLGSTSGPSWDSTPTSIPRASR